jgi:molybdopterin/thiamine biosynthesis adenylyltransferase
MFTKFNTRNHHVVYRTKHLQGVTDRQVKLKHFSQQALTNATITLIGAGGLGGEIGEVLVRKGMGRLKIFDPDYVDPTNLNRQLFYAQDLNKPKAHRLAANLAKMGFGSSVIAGYSLSFEDALKHDVDLSCNVCVVGIDNNPGRIAASVYFRQRQTPVIFTAVSAMADHGYVFCQEPGKACFGCLFTDAVSDETYPCPGTPAVKDILKTVSGIVSYCVDSLLMPRPRPYNYKAVYLATGDDMTWSVPRLPGCKLCGTPHHQPQTPIPSGQSEGGRP